MPRPSISPPFGPSTRIVHSRTVAPECSSVTVVAPRIHYERGLLHIEAGYPEAALAELCAAYPAHQLWPEQNLYFGGAHLAASGGAGTGDPRRGGVALVV